MSTSTDRIERQVLIKASRAKVWKALTNAEEFGRWFGVRFEGKSFVVGQHTLGQITYSGYEHLTMDVLIERIEPETLFSWRWHPGAVDANADYSSEPRTLVEFVLKDAEGGTLLTVVESGFDKIPAGRRLNAFRGNSEGWSIQVENIVRHVATH